MNAFIYISTRHGMHLFLLGISLILCVLCVFFISHLFRSPVTKYIRKKIENKTGPGPPLQGCAVCFLDMTAEPAKWKEAVKFAVSLLPVCCPLRACSQRNPVPTNHHCNWSVRSMVVVRVTMSMPLLSGSIRCRCCRRASHRR